jgi:hypothetical protein
LEYFRPMVLSFVLFPPSWELQKMIFFFREYVEVLDVYNYSLLAQSQINITERINFSIIIPEIFFLDKFCSFLPQIFDDNRFFVVFSIFFCACYTPSPPKLMRFVSPRLMQLTHNYVQGKTLKTVSILCSWFFWC